MAQLGRCVRATVDCYVDTGCWRRWLLAVVLMGVALGVTGLLVVSFFPGVTFVDRLTGAYQILWQNTTQRQFTFIMRDEPWLLILPAVAILFVSGMVMPLTYWARAAYLYLAFGVGVVFGHVFW